MPRYFFNMYDVNLDKDGTDIPSLKEMRMHMLAMASEVMADTKLRKDAWIGGSGRAR